MYQSVKQFVSAYPQEAAAIAAKSDRLSGLGKIEKGGLMTFSEVVKKYNRHIDEGHVAAWVWYQRKRGIPMKGGWASYAKINDKNIDSYVINGYLFVSGSDFLPISVFTYGNMYDRELQLKEDMEDIISMYGAETYENHLKTIQAAKPKILSVANPDEKSRPVILPFSSFAKEFTIRVYGEGFTDTIPNNSISAKELQFEVSAVVPYHSFSEFSLYNLFYHYLKHIANTQSDLLSPFQGIYAIWRHYCEGRPFAKGDTAAYKSEVEQFAPIVANRLFSTMLYELPASVRQRIDFAWNRENNGWSQINSNYIPIGFECSKFFKKADFSFSEAQREGAAFLQLSGSGCIAYDVGVGKTITAIISMLNDLYSGKIKRPLLVVPNPTYKKWIAEIFGYEDKKTGEYVYGVMSGTDYKLNDWYNLGTAYQSLPPQNKPVDAGSITLVTYEGFNKIGYSDDIFEDLFVELAEILVQKKDQTPHDKRDIAKLLEKYKEMLGETNKGTKYDIDKLGFDSIYIDEAHNFKNVFSYIPKDDDGKKRFSIETAQSTRAARAFFICNYIQRTYGNNVCLLTATPFTNNPVEIYSILSLVGYSYLVKYGLKNLYDFTETFINQSYEYVNSYNGKIEQKHVVKGFNNRIILQRLIRNLVNYKTGEQAGVKRPYKINFPKLNETKNGVKVKLPRNKTLQSFLKPTELQIDNQVDIENYPNRFTGFEKIKAVMKSLAMNLDNALSPYLLNSAETPESYLDFVNDSPKIKYAVECIKSVKQWHEKRGQECSGQVIYMNRGKEYFKYIKEYLEKVVGFKTNIKYTYSGGEKTMNTTVDEVEIITSSVSQQDREIIKEAFLAGVCKVIIGTASIREGIDLQNRGTVLYNLYPDWNPTDMKQLEGRIYRRGNQFAFVRIITPLVQDSMDVFVYQKYEEKAARLAEIWNTDAEVGNQIDLGESIDPDEVKFALFTKIEELLKIEHEKRTVELKREYSLLQQNQKTILGIHAAIEERSTYRVKVHDHILACAEPLSKFRDIVAIYQDKWEGVSSEKMKEYEDRADELVAKIRDYANEIPSNDKKLIEIYNLLNNSIFETRRIVEGAYGMNIVFDKFKSAVIEIAKAKETFYPKMGYNDDTDLKSEIAKNQVKMAEANKKLEYLNSKEGIAEMKEYIIERKERNKVEGRVAADATSDFENLNYLLSYPFKDDTEYTEIPQGEYQGAFSQIVKESGGRIIVAKVDNQANRPQLAKAKAKAIKIKLNLLKLKQQA